MRALWAIDPGPVESAILKYDLASGKPTWWAKLPNREVLGVLANQHGIRQTDVLAIEQIKSYGMAVGETTFETVYWSGRFADRWVNGTVHDEPIRIGRIAVKTHLCHSARAKDANVRQALVDRFGEKGTKANPGVLYGMSGDCWAALAVAVTVADTTPGLTAQ